MKIKRRTVPADNSCLFASVGNAVFGGQKTPQEIRNLVVEEILRQPDLFCEAALGKPVSEYCRWIRQPSSWGGYIELSALSPALGLRIIAFDVQTGVPQDYGPELASCGVVYLIYDGIHYDYVAPADGSKASEAGPAVFASEDESVRAEVTQLCADLRAQQQYTDLGSMQYLCRDCNTKFESVGDIQVHATTTGHANFVQNS